MPWLGRDNLFENRCKNKVVHEAIGTGLESYGQPHSEWMYTAHWVWVWYKRGLMGMKEKKQPGGWKGGEHDK